MRAVARELRLWRRKAEQIPDAAIRRDALSALARKRGNTNGAALFWTIPKARCPVLLKLLVAYQVMWDFLDSANETGVAGGPANGEQLHLALVDAVDARRPISDYYRHHPWRDDGGYLQGLVEACRACSAALPSFGLVRPLLVREARRANIQAINHHPQRRREAALRDWAASEYAGRTDVSWFELTAAAGAGISIYALFALAVEPACGRRDVASVYRAYFPWASALATMLDSYVDEREDKLNGDHVYVDYYGSHANARSGIAKLIRRSLVEAKALPEGERQAVVVACMIAMYLSKTTAWATHCRRTTKTLLDEAGLLPKVLTPMLLLWRIANRQRCY